MASSTHQPVTPAASKENISPLFRPYIRHHAYTPFYKAVCARFSKHVHPTLPEKRQPTAAEAAASAAMIDWRGMDRIVRPENLPEEEDESDVAPNIADPVFNPLYQAQGKYEFMNRKPLKGVKTLQYLGCAFCLFCIVFLCHDIDLSWRYVLRVHQVGIHQHRRWQQSHPEEAQLHM